jgi:hypothetical protein
MLNMGYCKGRRNVILKFGATKIKGIHEGNDGKSNL